MSTQIFGRGMNITENQFGQTKHFLGQASPEVFASLNSEKENYASLSDTFSFLSEGGMVRWNFPQPFEANIVPKYLQEIAVKIFKNRLKKFPFFELLFFKIISLQC